VLWRDFIMDVVATRDVVFYHAEVVAALICN
jgi:hypothetical protein